eukprot:gnl/Hemi2/10774_TR3693_c0_g1_i1.p1 gnl/Hemi2/10774_TR3693_c0_g1~~gnl/Hemi2/10774_TR3693_c0_g1_i1.p1  ORF type:complete len:277 (+),score=121.87 gnl/Hemi2/10774_TR3693_c0_g1_i1:92-922(+)
MGGRKIARRSTTTNVAEVSVPPGSIINSPPGREGRVSCDDATDTLIVIGFSLFWLYKITIGALLAIFVPQSCGSGAASYTCGVGDTVSNSTNTGGLSTFNIIVLVFNFFTLLWLVIVDYLEFSRERWIISHLDEDLNEPDTALPQNLEPYPQLRDELHVHNTRNFWMSLIALLLVIANTILSAILLFGPKYDGYQTITTLISSVLLVGWKYVSDVKNLMLGWRHGYAYSTIQTEPASFNVVDHYIRSQHGDTAAHAAPATPHSEHHRGPYYEDEDV